jgi:hypothetical protein
MSALGNTVLRLIFESFQTARIPFFPDFHPFYENIMEKLWRFGGGILEK